MIALANRWLDPDHYARMIAFYRTGAVICDDERAVASNPNPGPVPGD